MTKRLSPPSIRQKYGNSGSQTADLDRQTETELAKLKCVGRLLVICVSRSCVCMCRLVCCRFGMILTHGMLTMFIATYIRREEYNKNKDAVLNVLVDKVTNVNTVVVRSPPPHHKRTDGEMGRTWSSGQGIFVLCLLISTFPFPIHKPHSLMHGA